MRKKDTLAPINAKIFARNLSRELDRREITQTDFARLLKVTNSTVSAWTRGAALPGMSRLNKICETLNVPAYKLLPGKQSIADRYVKIPILGSVIAGIPISAIENIIGYEDIPSKLAETGEFFALKVKGDSMEPEMKEGDIVIVKQQSDVLSGSIAIVLFDGEEATIKKVVKSESGITLVGYNVSVYEPHSYTNEQIQEHRIQIIGQVIQIRRNL